MTATRAAAIVLAAALILAPAQAGAQDPVKSFDQLNTRLKVGDTIWVTDAEGREIKGTIRSLSTTSFAIERDGMVQDFPAPRAQTILVQPKDSLRNGVLWGLAGGFLAGAGSCAFNPDCGDDGSGASLSAALGLIGSAIGMAIGAGVDAAIKGPKLVVYQAAPAVSPARLSLAPVVTTRQKGFAVSWSF